MNRRFTYKNPLNTQKMIKYSLGFIAGCIFTFFYSISENKNIYVVFGFIALTCALFVPWLTILFKVLFEVVEVNEEGINLMRGATYITRIRWKSVQYLVNLPATTAYKDVYMKYEVGDLKHKKKIVFDTTMNDVGELLSFIKSHVGTLKALRKVY